MSVSFTIMAILIPIFLYINNSYQTTIIKNRDYFYTKETFAYIESALIQDAVAATVNNNTIYITKNNGINGEKITNVVEKRFSNIYVKYYTNDVLQSSNIVLRNIKDLNIKIKNKILYVSITLLDEFYIERCLPLNYLN